MLRPIGIKAAAAIKLPPVEFEGDTTHMLLDGEGPVTIRTGPDPLTLQAPFTGPIHATLSGDQGGDSFQTTGPYSDQGRFNFKDASWTQGSGGGRRVRIRFPEDSGLSGEQVYCAGGVIAGQADRDRTWQTNKNMSAVAATNHIIFDGFRIDNVGEDACFLGGAVDGGVPAVLMNSWISWCPDDAVDSRPHRSPKFTIVDCLLDENFYCCALDVGSSSSAGDEFGHVYHVENTLMRNRRVQNDSGSWRGVHFFKTRTGITTRLINVVFGVSIVRTGSSPDSRFRKFLDWCDFASGNVVCWLDPTFPDGSSAGSYPVGSWPHARMQELNAQFPGAFRLLQGQNAWNFWNRARDNWINGHPKVGRVNPAKDGSAGDPESFPANHDPTAYGGKGTNMPPGYTGPEPVQI